MHGWIDILIVALIPLTALFTVVQTQPYFALVSRGIMGVTAVLLYAVMGAPDVALTEALVGTLLTVTLYAVTVRSTRVLRLGVLFGKPEKLHDGTAIGRLCAKYDLAVRSISFNDEKELAEALKHGRIDAVHMMPERLPSLAAVLPLDLSSDQCVTILARHGRWHELKMKALFDDHEQVLRLGALTAKETG